MRRVSIVAISVAVLGCIGGCSNDSSIRIDGCSECSVNQVCSGAGICYDDPDCEICGADEVCVGGACYDKTSACAKCDASDVCHNEQCFDADDPCAKCGATQVCRMGTCYEATDPCLSCGEAQVCVGGTCYDKTDACARCKADQVCKNEKCYEATDPCLECRSDQLCIDQTCRNIEGSCLPECASDEVCLDGTCEPCPEQCGGTCCEAGEVCDAHTQKCAEACEDGAPTCYGVCCEGTQVCDASFGCLEPCAETETRCDNLSQYISQCCVAGTVCDAGECKEDCGAAVRCNDVCCQEGEICEDLTCKIACDAATHTRCGENDEFCCDNASQVCVSQKCLPRGNSCKTVNDCDFDEICETSTMTCVNADDIVSTCEIKPKFGEFKPLLQFNWPSCLNGGKPSQYSDYTRVIVMPMAANMTDDNADGVIDVYDVPDIIFMSYSTKYGPDTQAPSVLRVISGDDGHEIVSSSPRYWTYPISSVVADIDNDGKNEIVIGTNNHRVSGSLNFSIDENDKIEALSVEPDASSPTGYKLVQKYAINISNASKLSFISVADLDSDGVPEILTNVGVVSVVNGNFAWREGCQKNMGFGHAADIDGDGVMEIVTSSAIYDDHCKTLVSGLKGGNIAIADLMPSSADAAETGELVPEIAHVVPGTPTGRFYFTKIFKQAQADGTFKWSAKVAWEAVIPRDDARAKLRGCNNGTEYSCSTGGGTPVIADFNGDTIPDIGVASRYYYIVYSNDGTPNGGKVLWADGKTQDYSSAVTGSSVFDFEGDGKAEVVYSDETKLRIYAGEGSGVDADGDGYNDPKIIWETSNLSATGYEYPIIVDVDNDGSTEIVLSSDMGATVGINVYEDPGAQWVRTRRIWNQHHYHVTNINEDGSVPKNEVPNWLHPKLNNYRQNIQPAGAFNAPNLVANGISSNLVSCDTEERVVELIAQVSNDGALGIKSGLSVKFYLEDVNGTGKNAFIGEAFVKTILAPGQAGTAVLAWNQRVTLDGVETKVLSPAKISFVIDEPTAEKEYGEFVECIESDNTLAATLVALCQEKVN